MLERARGYRADAVLGRWIIETTHANGRWEVVVEPDAVSQATIVVTAYEVV